MLVAITCLVCAPTCGLLAAVSPATPSGGAPVWLLVPPWQKVHWFCQPLWQPSHETPDAPPVSAADRNTAYQFEFAGLWTDRLPMTAFEGEVVLVVNTASRCGFTPQYEGLQAIYNEYNAQGFEVVGVPANNFMGQEPGSAEEIQEFCTLNYGVTFPMAGKTDVVGEARHPFYAWAQTQLGDAAVPGWNFHKLLIGRDGRLIAAFPSDTEPTSEDVRAAITAALAASAPNSATPTSLN